MCNISRSIRVIICKYSKLYLFDLCHIISADIVTYLKLALQAVQEYNQLTKDIANSEKYVDRNRYRDVLPYDNNRIILKRNSLGYANASFVSDSISERNYILSQGPLENTAGHFWAMILERNCPAIVMLNKIIENQMVKCFQYFPTKDYPYRYFHDVNIEVNHVFSRNERNFIISKFKIVDLNTLQHKNVLHFHYVTWPDFGVPTSPMAFIEFLAAVRSRGVLQCAEQAATAFDSQTNKDEDEYYSSLVDTCPNLLTSNISTVMMKNECINGPTVVHCSAGIGRSGTFCLVDSCLSQIEQKNNMEIDICLTLHQMRRHRSGLVQTAKQLRFSYQAIIEGSQRILKLKGKNTQANFPSFKIGMISNIESDTNNHNNMSTAENSKTKPKQQSPLSEGNTSNNCKKYDEGQIADIDTTENTLSNSKTELRNRIAEDKTARLRCKLSEMKEKQKKCEEKAIGATVQKSYFTAAIGVGLAATILALYAAYSQM